MFEWDWISDLDGNQAADELARARDLVIAAEAGRFLLAAHWADLHAAEFVDECRRDLPGMPRLLPTGPDCPMIDEFAGAELAALSGMSTPAGESLIGDALLVRHRHPKLWEGIKNGRVQVWTARKVARRCAIAGITGPEALWVDAETAPYLETLPTKRFFDLVDAKIIEVDPTAADERARAESLRRFVHTGRADEHGMKTLVSRAHSGEITYLVAVLDRIAVILGERGDNSPLEARRATALRVLANPARALALLTGAVLEHLDPRFETTDETARADLHRGGTAGGLVTAQGERLHGIPDHEDLPLIDLADVPDTDADRIKELLSSPRLSDTVGSADASRDSEEVADPSLLREVADALTGFAASRLDPVAVFHVHVTDQTLKSRAGVARVEEVGPMALGEVRDWLTHPMSPEEIRQQVKVRAVLDAGRLRPVDSYEFPSAMSEIASLRNPYEVFPFGTLASRKCENDHPVPYQRGRPGESPPAGQTSLDNNAKLSKRHHRIKTHGGWCLLHNESGVYLWRTRHGHWLRVDQQGTHHVGRDSALDLLWEVDRASPSPAA